MTRIQWLTRQVFLFGLMWGIVSLIGTAAYPPQVAAQSESEKPFILPFKDPPGPDSWLMAQPYGNTIGAFFQRDTTYQAGQGIHFGVDFSAPCGTEVVAIADGVVFAVDNLNFGSHPHNLMIDHPDLGYASFYGHLLEPPCSRIRPRWRSASGLRQARWWRLLATRPRPAMVARTSTWRSATCGTGANTIRPS